MGVNGPLYATGCSVLFEGDVHRGWVARLGEEEQHWRPGPLVFTRRTSRSSAEPAEITAENRERRLGRTIAQHTLGPGRRFHRRVSHTVRTGSERSSWREMEIVAFELILGGGSEPIALPGATGAVTAGAWIPAVLVVHLDPPGRSAVDPAAMSEMRFEHIGNLIARFFRWCAQDCCRVFEELVPESRTSRHVVQNGQGFHLADAESADQGAEASVSEPESQSVLRLLASGPHTSTASFPMYWVLTDVAPDEASDIARWDDDIEFYECDGGGKPFGLDHCAAEERRARRSRALAELEVRPWARSIGGATSALADGDGAPWRNWHASFSRSGAGFAHAVTTTGHSTNRHRRDDLSTVYVDLFALEMLKDRVIQSFSELTRDLASGVRSDAELRQRCVETWKSFVTFTSEYFGRSSGLNLRDRDVLEAFRAGTGLDLDQDLARAQANLERLAEMARMEIDEERSARDREQAEAERDRLEEEKARRDRTDASERRFNRFVGVLATVVIPLTVVPPIVELFLPLPSTAAWIVGVLAIVLFGACIGVMLWRFLRSREQGSQVRMQSAAAARPRTASHEPTRPAPSR